jgi:hypothetical protein
MEIILDLGKWPSSSSWIKFPAFLCKEFVKWVLKVRFIILALSNKCSVSATGLYANLIGLQTLSTAFRLNAKRNLSVL